MEPYRSLTLATVVLVPFPMLCLAQQNRNRAQDRPDHPTSRGTTTTDANQKLINYLAGKIMLANQVECHLAKTAAKDPRIPTYSGLLNNCRPIINSSMRSYSGGCRNWRPWSTLDTSSANSSPVRAEASASQQSEQREAGESPGKPLDGPARRLMRSHAKGRPK